MRVDLHKLASEAGSLLKKNGLMLSAAESCTGGQIAQTITSIPGSSHWFDRGFVTYSNEAKIEMLGVQPATIAIHGAVSEYTAREMAEGALRYSHANISLAVTGIAGPDGGTAEKPVGTVWLAWATQSQEIQARYQLYQGDRLTIREQATAFALQYLIEYLQKIGN